MGSLAHWSLTATLVAGCLPAAKEKLDDPPVRSPLTAALVGQLGDGRDVRDLRAREDRLYVADAEGLLIYDISTPSSPALIGSIGDGRVDHLALVGRVIYLIEVGGDRLREWDVSDASRPTLLSDERSLTRTFGGIDARDGLVWHAVGSSPPSRLFYRQPVSLADSCAADDRERGIMGVWLHDGLVILSVHFDDFAGDGLDGNGGFGFALFDLVSPPGACPTTRLTDILLAETHGLNRSEFETPTNSDLQTAYVASSRTLFTVAEQRVSRFAVSAEGQARLEATLAIPEVLDVELDPARPEVLGLANGDFALVTVDDDGELAFGGRVETPGVARAVAAAADGQHFYVADGEAGVAVVAYGDRP